MTVACSAYDSECLTRAAKRFHRHVFDQNTNILKTHWVKCTRPLTTGDRLLREHVEVSKDESRGPFRMPVAPLVQTCQQLLETVKPLLADSQLEAATKLVHKFTEKGGIGEKLQSLLQKRAGERESWLSEWWQNYGYLDYRASVPINVSPGIVMKEQVFRDSNDQIDFTSKFISGVLRYKKRLDSGQIASEQMLGQPVCMSQYYKIFASCRRPHPLRDSIAQHDTKEARHVVVLHNNHFFLMPITDREGQTPNHRQLRDQLRLIIDASNTTMAPPVGLMTGCDRDYWAAATANLLRDPNNHDIIDCIERSAFVLCLDRPHAPTLEPRPLTRPREPTDRYTTLGRQMNYGGGSLLNSANRWYDKTLQIIIGSDGAFGASYEHTAAEGPPVVTLLDEAYDYVMSSPKDFEPCQEMETPKKLEFVIDSSIEEDMKAAAEIVDKQISRFELHSYTFRDFGKESIKNLKMSPDAFIQVSLQLAYFRFHNISICRSQYHVLDSIDVPIVAPVAPVTPPRNPTARLHSAPCATYESGSLRRFHSGRTDVIRSCSSHSLAYTMAMVDPECSDKQRAAAFRVAVAAHSKYSKQVVMGNGIDRHLLGLKLIAEENNIPIPDLFKHPAWTESTSWKLSTSQVASKSDSLLTFGAVVADGYGFCYNPCDDHINYMVSAWRESRLTSCADFSRQVQRALLDGRRVLHTVSVEK